MKKTMAFRIVADTNILIHANMTPSESEWHTWVDTAIAARVTRSLVITPGPGPTGPQRKEINEKVTATALKTRTAVVTDNPVARGIVTAIAWLRAYEIRAFAPSHINDALAYLDLLRTEKIIHQIIAELRAELDAPNT